MTPRGSRSRPSPTPPRAVELRERRRWAAVVVILAAVGAFWGLSQWLGAVIL